MTKCLCKDKTYKIAESVIGFKTLKVQRSGLYYKQVTEFKYCPLCGKALNDRRKP